MENYYEHLLAPDGNQDFAAYIISMLDDLNYGLVRIKINGKRVTNIQIMAENDQHTLSFEDCEILNEAIIDYLEKNEKLFANYTLEISSPGIERPLTRQKDFNIWSNNFVQIKLNSDKDFPKKFKAKLLGFSENKIKIFIEDESDFNGEYNLDPLMIKEVILSWEKKTRQNLT